MPDLDHWSRLWRLLPVGVSRRAFGLGGGLLGGASVALVEPDDFALAALAQIDGVPVGGDQLVIGRPLTDVAAADCGRCAQRRIAAGVVDLGPLQEVEHDAGGPQPLEI